MSTSEANPTTMPRDIMDRSEKGPSPLGTTIFVGLRAADVLLQYSLISRGWATNMISRLGGQAVTSLALPGSASILGLQPYHAIVASLALGSSLKHIIWLLFVSEMKMPVANALIVATFNTVLNSLNTIFSLWAVTSLSPPPASVSSPNLSESFANLLSRPTISLGIALYAIGILTEITSEFQRKIFKSNPANKEKPYGGGLFSLATNINYGGYTLWRAGYATLCAGLPWGGFIAAFLVQNFVTNAIPELDSYCTNKYGKAWEDIKKRTPYKLIPGLY